MRPPSDPARVSVNAGRRAATTASKRGRHVRFDGDVTEPGAASDEWTVILPVKTLSTAKSRMSAAGGGPSASLAMAFFQDTLTAVSDCLLVSHAIIATADRVIGGLASAQGCLVVDDTGHPGINQAARWAATAAEPASRIAILVSDLPCLTAESLQAVLTCARVHERSFLADAAGTGTTMWFAGAGDPPRVMLRPILQAGTQGRRTCRSRRPPRIRRAGIPAGSSRRRHGVGPRRRGCDRPRLLHRRGPCRNAPPLISACMPKGSPTARWRTPSRATGSGDYFFATAFLAGAAFFAGAAAFLTGAAFFAGAAAFLTGAAFFTGAAAFFDRGGLLHGRRSS